VGIAFLLAAAVLFGFMPIVVKLAFATGMSTFEVFLLRSGIGALALSIIVVLRGKASQLRLTTDQMGPVAFVALMFVGAVLMLYSSYNYISSGAATSLHYLYPVIVMVVMHWIVHEHMGALKWLAVALSVAGVFLIGNPWAAGFSLPGVLLAAFSSVFFALYTVAVGSRWFRELDSMVAVFYFCLLAFIVSLFIVPLTGGRLFVGLPVRGVLWCVVLGIFCTAVPMVLFMLGTSRVGPSSASVYSTLEPAVALIAGIVLLGEPLTWDTPLGCVLIMSGILLVAFAAYRRHTRAAGDGSTSIA